MIKEKGVNEFRRDGFRVLEVDISKAEFKGLKWTDLGAFGKRKFENLIVLRDTSMPTKIVYN